MSKNNCMVAIDCLLVPDEIKKMYEVGDSVYLECQYIPSEGVYFNDRLIFSEDEFLKYHMEIHGFSNIHDSQDLPFGKFMSESPKGAKRYYFACTNSRKEYEENKLGRRVVLKENGIILHVDEKEYVLKGYTYIDIYIREEVYCKRAV